MSQYLFKFAGSNSQVEYLWDTITHVADKSNILPDGVDLGDIMYLWVRERHYPLLTVNVNNQGVITVSQVRG